MPSTLSIQYLDYSGEKSSAGITGPNITAANYAARVTEMDTLINTIDAITLGVQSQNSFTARVVRGSSVPPVSTAAQRESKWLVVYQDNQSFLDPGTNTIPNPGFGKLFNVEIPCADLSMLQPSSDLADLSNPAMSNFITAFEVWARSPYGGTVTITQIRYVGRAL